MAQEFQRGLSNQITPSSVTAAIMGWKSIRVFSRIFYPQKSYTFFVTLCSRFIIRTLIYFLHVIKNNAEILCVRGVSFSLFFLFLSLFDASLHAKCVGRFVNPVTDICWKCLFPIKIAGFTIVGGGPDPAGAKGFLCACGKPKPRIGIPVSFWEPARLVDVTRTPYCLVNMGGISVANTGTAASEMICQDAMRDSGKDWFEARKHCQKDGAVASKVNDVRKKSPDLLQGEYNLTWHVLQKMPQYKDGKDFCSFIMTTIGTLISRKDDKDKYGRVKIHTIEGKGDQRDYLTAYLKGGKTARYSCDENDRCLNPKLGEIGIRDDGKDPQSMKAKTSRRIHELWNKYKNDQKINSSELAFLNDAVNVPVYRYIQIAAAVGTPFIMDDTSEYIAISVLLTQFDKISAEIIEALDNLQSVQLESGTLEGFKNNIQSMRGRIQMLLSRADGEAVWRLNQMIRAHEQTLAARND